MALLAMLALSLVLPYLAVTLKVTPVVLMLLSGVQLKPCRPLFCPLSPMTVPLIAVWRSNHMQCQGFQVAEIEFEPVRRRA